MNSDFFRIPETVTIWEVLNSEFFVALVAIIVGAWINASIRKNEKLEIEREQNRQAESESEMIENKVVDQIEHNYADNQPGSRPQDRSTAPLDEGEFRSDAQKLVDKAKRFVDQKIDKERDGRYRRAYKNILKSRYDLKIAALLQRGRITPSEYDKLKETFVLWRSYSIGRGASRAVPMWVKDRLIELTASLNGE